MYNHWSFPFSDFPDVPNPFQIQTQTQIQGRTQDTKITKAWEVEPGGRKWWPIRGLGPQLEPLWVAVKNQQDLKAKVLKNYSNYRLFVVDIRC